MKLIALAAALAFGGTAIAQDAPATQTAPTGQTMDDPRGGYMPTTPPMSGTPTAGQRPVFVPNTQTPTQAFPPPAPLASYPWCKPGQFDNCRQRRDPK